MSEVSMFDANGMDRGSAFDIPLYGPEELQAGMGGVPDPMYQAGLPGQKVGNTRGDFHVQLPEAETLGRYGPPQGAMEADTAGSAGDTPFLFDAKDNNC